MIRQARGVQGRAGRHGRYTGLHRVACCTLLVRGKVEVYGGSLVMRSHARVLTETTARPAGAAKHFCEPMMATSTPHLSTLNGRRRRR